MLFFFSGPFERFIANLHISSRELTRLVLIKDYILNLKTQSLMACRCKTPWLLLLTKIFFLLFLQAGNEKLQLSAVYLAGRKIANT